MPGAPAPARAAGGLASGGVRSVLRLEGAAAFAAAIALYGHGGFSWLMFAVLFLAPDLSMLAYLAGPRAGALAYNLVHTYALAFRWRSPALLSARLSSQRWR